MDAAGSPRATRATKKHHRECQLADASHRAAARAKSAPAKAAVSSYSRGCASATDATTSWSKHANATVGRDVHRTLKVAMAAVVYMGWALYALRNPNHTLAMV